MRIITRHKRRSWELLHGIKGDPPQCIACVLVYGMLMYCVYVSG